MGSVKILIANRTSGSGKTTLSIALAFHLHNTFIDHNLQPLIFDCSDHQFLFSKRQLELEKNKEAVPSFQILTLPLSNRKLFENNIDLISKHDGAYIFDVSAEIQNSDLFNLVYVSDVILCPFVLTDTGIYETAKFVHFIKKAVQTFKNKGFSKDPPIILIPNMVPENGIDPHISEYWEEKTKAFIGICKTTPNVPWANNLLKIMSTTKPIRLMEEIFKAPFQSLMPYITNPKNNGKQ